MAAREQPPAAVVALRVRFWEPLAGCRSWLPPPVGVPLLDGVPPSSTPRECCIQAQATETGKRGRGVALHGKQKLVLGRAAAATLVGLSSGRLSALGRRRRFGCPASQELQRLLLQLTNAQLERLNNLDAAAGARPDAANMATIDR